MKKWFCYILYAVVISLGGRAYAQTTDPLPGYIWTYFGPTLGAGWASLSSNPIILDFTGPIVHPCSGFSVQSAPGVTQQSIAAPIDGGNDCDIIQSTLRLLPGSTVKNAEAFGGYVSNRASSTGIDQNAAVNFGMITCEVNNCASWGANWIVTGGASNVIDTQTGRKLIGIELDMSAHSSSDIIQGIGLLGSSLVQPAGATGFTVGQLDAQQPVTGAVAKWTTGFSCQDGAIRDACLVVGATAPSGTSVGGQTVLYGWRDSSGIAQNVTSQVSGGGTMAWRSSASGPVEMAFEMDVAVAVNGVGANSPSYHLYLLYSDAANIAKNYSIAVDSSGRLAVGGNGTSPTVVLPSQVLISGMPTSCSGQAAGTLINTTGTVHIC